MNTVSITCLHCGGESKKRRAEIMRQKRNGRNSFFCSLSCAGYHLAAGKPPGVSNSTRAKVARQKYSGEWVCCDCGDEGNHLDVHHLDRDKFNNSDDNLVTLCRSCHVTRHNKEDAWSAAPKRANG